MLKLKAIGSSVLSSMRQILTVVALCSLAILAGCDDSSNTSSSSSSSSAQSGLMQPGPLPEKVLGKQDAPVTIIEYSSMTCPHCASFHKNTLPDLKKKYIDTGKVRYIIREFPLDDLATAAFMLGRCIENEKYFAFIDVLYERQRQWATSQNPLQELLAISKQAGFTEEKFNNCLKDQTLESNIRKIRERGSNSFGVRSTPTFFVNGKIIQGADRLEAFEKIMAPYLKKPE